ncbi:Hypothetical predicted protein [Mytilus galloprovincialis]|uniref:dCMP deaminase n=1 Tax=Mytilus galloprovincialis TaxID=29158 RepID=A0A8B6C646_MYTGA|nr:Hypothetical predicted protein [Mytilus galloprovincialis]
MTGEMEQTSKKSYFSQRNGSRGAGNGYNQKQNYVRDVKSYQRDCTVRIEVINTDVIGERIVIEDIETVTGLNSVLAVVKNDAMSYDITLDSKQTAFRLVQEGIDIANNEYQVSMLHSDITVVSIMQLPSFISDDDIRSKLVSKGVKIVSPIYRRAIPGTQVADGTRFMKCKFPQGMLALPWTIPFKIGSDTKYFRLVHNNQIKVCSECLSPEHMRKQCPYFVCHGCGQYGHSKRQCKASRCEYCHNLPLFCVCVEVAQIQKKINLRHIKRKRTVKYVISIFVCANVTFVGKKDCICACFKCEKYPCICTCSFCKSDPCVCPCQDCRKHPCVCTCDTCTEKSDRCTCNKQNDENGPEIVNITGENDDEDMSEVWSEEDVADTDPKTTVPIEVNVVQNKPKSHPQEENRKRKMDSDTESNNEITDDELLNLDNEEDVNENINLDKDFSDGKKLKIAICHAELNAVVNKIQADVGECRMFVTLFPCNECAKIIIQSGIKEVIYYNKPDIPEDDKKKQQKEEIRKATEKMFGYKDIVNLRPYKPKRGTDFKIERKDPECRAEISL